MHRRGAHVVRWMLRAAAPVGLCLLLAAGCTTGGSHDRTGASATPARSAPAPADPDRVAAVLQVTPAPYLLPMAITDATALADGNSLLLAGGTRTSGPTAVGRNAPGRTRAGTAGSLIALDPVTGAARTAGRTAAAAASRTPAARPGQVVVRMRGVSYLVGGPASAGPRAAVLATTDGSHFRVVARLPIPVSAPAVAALDGQIWVLGGQAAAGMTGAIQRIDLATGRARIAGRLPRPLAGAAGFTLDGRIFVAGGQTTAPAEPHQAGSPASAALTTSADVLAVDPAGGAATMAGRLPVPVAGGTAAVLGGTGYLLGGSDGTKAVPAVTTFRLVPPSRGVLLQRAPWLGTPLSAPHLAPGSDPAALPGDMLIADHLNSRLVIVDPQGRIRWEFPRPGDLSSGQTFLVPDDAFFSPDGRLIIATQEDDQVITVINVATRKIVYRYGKPGTPGMGPDQVDNPDDAMLAPNGGIVTADIKNCRILQIMPPAHRPLRVIGQSTNSCWHDPPYRFGSPNGAFPLTDGRYLITEINGDWADEMSLAGRVSWSAQPPGVVYPSDSNEIYPGRYLTADYSSTGQLVEFDAAGHLLWRRGGFNHPSLALPLPNGDILANDDFNNRVVVINPVTKRIVWQYGHTGVAGQAPGYLNDPDGVDLIPPDSMLITHAATMGRP